MSRIESNPAIVATTAENVYNFLLNTDNIEKLLPAGKYSDWKSDGKTCSFKVQGSYQIGLALEESEPFKTINYVGTPGSPFPFKLQITLNEENAKTTALLICDAQINPFLEMIVKGPLKALFDYMSEKLTTNVQ
jgi:hypothetical protein